MFIIKYFMGFLFWFYVSYFFDVPSVAFQGSTIPRALSVCNEQSNGRVVGSGTLKKRKNCSLFPPPKKKLPKNSGLKTSRTFKWLVTFFISFVSVGLCVKIQIHKIDHFLDVVFSLLEMLID